MRKVVRPSLLRLIRSRNGSKRTRSRILSGVFKRQYPITSNLQFIGKPILEALPVHITFYLCDHAGADKKKAKNSTGTIDTTNIVSSVDNDQDSISNELEVVRPKKTRITMKSSIRIGCTAKIIKHVMTDDTIHVEYHWVHLDHCPWDIKEITNSRLPFEVKQWITEKVSENMDWKTIKFLRIDDERLIEIMMLLEKKKSFSSFPMSLLINYQDHIKRAWETHIKRDVKISKSTQDTKLVRDRARANLNSMMYSETPEAFDLAYQLSLAENKEFKCSAKYKGVLSCRSRSLRVDRLVYLLSQVVALDYWQDTIKDAHDFGGFRLTANEEKKGRAAYCIDYDITCSVVEQLEENVYQCRSFTEDILFYKMDTKEGFLKNCSCPDQTKMCKHIFSVSRVTKLPFSPHAPVPVAQQERFSTLNEDQGLLCHELLLWRYLSDLFHCISMKLCKVCCTNDLLICLITWL
ncbi:hypothetical protein G6F69_007211 [Rhizopus microsporus]|nr:hypothetical protein G6F69_007211 [Rhizopus microsporus]